MGEPATCGVCGTAVEDRPATWSMQISTRGVQGQRVVQGQRIVQWLCDRCTRDNLRSIEGKLDEAWW